MKSFTVNTPKLGEYILKPRRMLTAAVTGMLALSLSIPNAAFAASDLAEGTLSQALHAESSSTDLAHAEKEFLSKVPASELKKPAENSAVSLPTMSDPTIKLDGATIEVVGASFDHFGSSGSATRLATAGVTDFAFREHKDGAQAIFSVESPAAPHKVSFTLSNQYAFLSATDLGIESNEVFVLDARGKVHSTINEPWAYDALGNPVETHFEVTSGTLTQVVVPGAHTKYPIVADPDFVKITKCVGTILANVALYIVPGGIIGRLLAKGNSIRKAAEIIVRTVKAKNYNDKLKALRNLALTLGADISGIGLIAKACG